MQVNALRPSAVVLCYYFQPSPEVAARRLSAFTGVIAACGFEVLVVSAFGGSRSPALQDGVTPIPIVDSPRHLIGSLVALKKSFTRVAQAAGWKSPSLDVGVPRNDTSRAPGQRFADALVRFLCTIDGYKRWSVRAAFAALRAARSRRVQLVVGSGPHFSAVIAARFVARRLRAPFIADFRDPMSAGGKGVLHMGALSNRLRRYFEPRIVATATAICTASPGIASALRERYPAHAGKVKVIFNGFDGEPLPRILATGHRLNILFAGCLYVNRDPFPLLNALESLLSRPGMDASRVRLRLVGDCAAFRGESLAGWLAGRRIEEVVEVIPELPVAELRPYFDEATVLLNFAQGQPRQIPAKTFEHLASGRELLAFCEPDSDTGRLLAGIGGTIQIAPGDGLATERALLDLYDRHVVKGVLSPPSLEEIQSYSRLGQNRAFESMVRTAVAEE